MKRRWKHWRYIFLFIYAWNLGGMIRMNWIAFLNYLACCFLMFMWIQITAIERDIERLKLETEDLVYQRLGGVIGRN